MDGVLRCARYAFSPNKLHLCGPDANREVFSYIKEGASDSGLENILSAFHTMYPYLRHIAEANKIRDPFDDRVVEAYWIGNDLLEIIDKKVFYRHIIDGQKIKKRIKSTEFNQITDKIRLEAVPHHSFHVFMIWKTKKNYDSEYRIEDIDNCRISWGTIEKIDGPFLFVKTKPLLYIKDKLILGQPIIKKISRIFTTHYDIERLQTNDIISMHWNMPCEVITTTQATMLEKYTLRHIKLINLDL
jgi:hypothetical protein